MLSTSIKMHTIGIASNTRIGSAAKIKARSVLLVIVMKCRGFMVLCCAAHFIEDFDSS